MTVTSIFTSGVKFRERETILKLGYLRERETILTDESEVISERENMLLLNDLNAGDMVQRRRAVVPSLNRPVISTSNQPPHPSSLLALLGLVPLNKHLIFLDIKNDHFQVVLKNSAEALVRTDDEYDYPEDLLVVKINR